MNIKFNTFLAAIMIVCFCAFPMTGMSNVRADAIPALAATVPTPISPSGTISNTNPTFTWSKISGATFYQFKVYNGSSLAYPIKTVAASACGSSATNCSNTPTTALSYAAHSWTVRAYVGGVWNAYSAYKGFTITNIPTPLAPTGTISDDTPTFTWSRISEAVKYQFAVYKGATLEYTQVVATSLCGSSSTNCSNTPTTALSDGAYTWEVRAYVGGATWKTFSDFKSFTVKTIPTPLVPNGTITDTTPTFTWSKISAATQYSFSVYTFDNRGAILKYSKTVAASACGSSTTNCSNTPTTVLSAGKYTWKVRAYVGGWRAYSATKSFTIPVPKPKNGFWMSTTGEWFYVNDTQDAVSDFSVHEDWGDCQWEDEYYIDAPISNHSFSFDTGYGWSADGTFTSYTTASGHDIFNDYWFTCNEDDSLTDSWSYTAKWINDCQPLAPSCEFR